MNNVEIEGKFDANTPRAFWRAKQFLKKVNPHLQQQQLHIKDVYLDHPNRDLANQKIALRVRNTDGKWEATFKTRTEIKNGKAVRREVSLPLPNVKNLAQALAALNRKKYWQGMDVKGLCAQFTIVNKRSVLDLNYDGAKLEIALDNFIIRVQKQQIKRKEIEIEIKQGAPKKLDKFLRIFKRETQLQTAKISKVKTAEKFLKLIKKQNLSSRKEKI